MTASFIDNKRRCMSRFMSYVEYNSWWFSNQGAMGEQWATVAHPRWLSFLFSENNERRSANTVPSAGTLSRRLFHMGG
jgi:hypothetical protein